MTKVEAAEKYKENAIKLAEIVDSLGLLQFSFDYVSSAMGDDGDPGCCTKDALAELAKALASAVLYAKDYEEESKND